MKYQITAEHCAGKSVGHPCTKGVYSDPVDDFDETVEAVNAEDAERAGRRLLEQIAADAEPCWCHRRLSPGSDAWWDSVALTAETVDV